MPPAVAFFDLDKTLISRNSATLWIRYELSGGRITTRQALHALGWVLRYSLGAADMEGPIRRTIASMRGEHEAPVRERTQRFYDECVRSLYRPGARAALEAHRTAGDRLVLLTSSSSYLSEAVCRELGLDDYVANRFEVNGDGTYSGRPIEPLCFGPGKVTLAATYLESLGVDFADTVFYSDSHSDLPMLEAVGRPVVVHPDPRLLRLARRRGWTIVDWGVA